MPRPNISIRFLPRDPLAYLLARDVRAGLCWSGLPHWRVWPAGNYRVHVELEAANEYCARIEGAIRLRVSGDKVKVQRVPAMLLTEGKA